ncbi:MAG: c-type cytochrome [Methylibium sp.]|nr:c-type cytochrome [Methylibium sp.]
MAQTASAGTAATDTPPAAAAEVTLTADTAGDITAASAPAGGGASAAVGAGSVEGKLYQVVDGYKVDEATMEGFRTWRAAACDRCHGANQEGMVGPSLIESLKVRDKAYFVDVLTNGRLVKGMPSFNTNTLVMENLDELYAYLKGRSDGAITRAKVQPMS